MLVWLHRNFNYRTTCISTMRNFWEVQNRPGTMLTFDDYFRCRTKLYFGWGKRGKCEIFTRSGWNHRCIVNESWAIEIMFIITCKLVHFAKMCWSLSCFSFNFPHFFLLKKRLFSSSLNLYMKVLIGQYVIGWWMALLH